MHLVCSQRWFCTLTSHQTAAFTCSALGTWKAECLVHRRHSANASLCLLYAPSLWLSLINSQTGPWAIWSLRTGPYQQ